MKLENINSYINPFSKGFQCAADKFSNLNSSQKSITVCLTILAGLATLFCGGAGGFATFKALVDRYSVTKLEQGEDKTADKSSKVAEKELNLKEKTEVNPVSKYDSVPLAELLQTANLPLIVPSPSFGITDEDVKKIQNELSEEDKIIYAAIVSKLNPEISGKKGEELKEVVNARLAPFLEQPLRYLGALSSILFLMGKNKYFHKHVHILLEQLEWPNEEIKVEQTLLLMEKFISTEGGIYFGNWYLGSVMKTDDTSKTAYFPCYSAALNTKMVFAHGKFRNDEPWMTESFVKSIGKALIKSGKMAVADLKQNIGDPNKRRTGLKLDIGQFMETRFPAALIAPLLPYLKDVPGIVSLDLSDIGTDHKKDAFGDEHAEALLNIVISQPYLLNFTVNTKGMSEEKEKAFWKDVNAILQARKQLFPLDPVRFLEILAPEKSPLMIYSVGKEDTL